MDRCIILLFNPFVFSSLQTFKMIDLLIKSVEKKDWKAYIFTSLVELLRKADEDTLSQIWDHCSSDEQQRYSY